MHPLHVRFGRSVLRRPGWAGPALRGLAATALVIASFPLTAAFPGSRMGGPRPAEAAVGDVTTLAGTGTAGLVNGSTSSATFNFPWGLVITGGSTYITDKENNVIRKITGTTVTTFAGGSTASGTCGGVASNTCNDDADGTVNPLTVAQFSGPKGIATDGTFLYIADQFNHRIRKIDLVTVPGAVTTLAGTGSPGYLDHATGTSAQFNFPEGVAYDTGFVYVADRNNHRIRKVNATTGVVTTLAGSGTMGFVDNATGTSAQFSNPVGVAASSTDVYVGDHFGIRRISLAGVNPVTTLAGSSGQGSSDNATGTSAGIGDPTSLALNRAVGPTILYFADAANHKIRQVSLTSPFAVTTISGTGVPGFADGSAGTALFKNPAGVTYTPTDGVADVRLGDLFVADQSNHRIRQVFIASSPPAPDTLLVSPPTPSAPNKAPNTFSITVQSIYSVTGLPANVVSATSITLTVKAGTGTGTLGGTTTRSIAAGSNSVTFSGLTYSEAQSGLQLTATRNSGDTLAAGDSPAFNVLGLAATKLAVTVSPTSPSVSPSSFTATITSQDSSSTATSVVANTTVTLTKKTGTGALGGNVTGVILAGTNTITITGVTYNVVETGVVLTATATSGDTLSPGDSATFSVLAPAIVVKDNVTLTPITSTTSGALVTLTGNSFSPNVTGHLHLNGTAEGATTTCATAGVHLAVFTASAAGAFTVTNVTIPLPCVGAVTVLAYEGAPTSASLPISSTSLTVNATSVVVTAPFTVSGGIETPVTSQFVGDTGFVDVKLNIVTTASVGSFTVDVGASGVTLTSCDIGALSNTICSNSGSSARLVGINTAGLVGTVTLARMAYTVSGALGSTASVTPSVVTLTDPGNPAVPIANTTTPGTLTIGSKCDVNLSGGIDVTDALVILRFVVGLDTSLPTGTGDANTSGGTATSADALYVLQFVVGTVASCPQ